MENTHLNDLERTRHIRVPTSSPFAQVKICEAESRGLL